MEEKQSSSSPISNIDPLAQTNDQLKQSKKKNQNQTENLYNLIFNIVLPVIILNQVGKHFGNKGPLLALVLGLAFPIGYGIFELYQKKKMNWLSVLGIANVAFSGGFALFKLEGNWFVVKETAFPLIIGIVVLISAYTKKPLIALLIYNDMLINKELVDEKLIQHNQLEIFEKHLKICTILLAISFFISALLNYLLAIYVFTDLPLNLSENEQSHLRNEQIARMTWLGYSVIALPSLIITAGILFYLINGIKKHTGLKLEEILRQN